MMRGVRCTLYDVASQIPVLRCTLQCSPLRETALVRRRIDRYAVHQCEVARVVAAHCRHAAANSEACPTHGHTCGDAGVSAKRRTAKPHVWGLSRTFGGYQAEHRKSGLYRTHTSGRRAKHAALMEHRRQHESASEWSRKKNAIERMVQPRPHLCIGRTVSLAAAVCHALIRTIFRVSVPEERDDTVDFRLVQPASRDDQRLPRLMRACGPAQVGST